MQEYNPRDSDAIDTRVGKRIREERILRGLSRMLLAKELGISHQQLKKYEDGDNRISAGRIYILSRFFNIPIESLFMDNGDLFPASLEHPLICLEVARSFPQIEDPEQRNAVYKLIRSLATSN